MKISNFNNLNYKHQILNRIKLITFTKFLQKNGYTLLDLSVSSLRRGHANLLCIVPILTDVTRR